MDGFWTFRSASRLTMKEREHANSLKGLDVFFIIFSLTGSLQAEHLLTPVRKGHFFLPPRTVFFI